MTREMPRRASPTRASGTRHETKPARHEMKFAWRRARIAALLAALAIVPAACFARPAPGSLAPTLTMESGPTGTVAMQNGVAVPTFSPQPRAQISLDGAWRVERTQLDTDLSLTDRSVSLPALEKAAGGRQAPGFDDGAWSRVDVPGTIDPAPAGTVSGAWYRRSFEVPETWAGLAVTLKFGAVNYIGDVWLNGHYLGYHEGGHTPFAFPAEHALAIGGRNELAVRVDVPEWGSRTDLVPWGLADWWEYGGITQSVWLEATPTMLAARADAVPHLDGADLSVVVENRGSAEGQATVAMEILPGRIVQNSLLDPDARSLIAPGAVPVVSATVQSPSIAPGGHAVVDQSIAIAEPDLWEVGRPALYVLHVAVRTADGRADDLYETFGLRRIAVDPEAPRLLLNGEPILLAGVATHQERIKAGPSGTPIGMPLTTAQEALDQLDRARSVSADFVRTGHTPALPALLTLADRLGFAIWEEIPLYHFTPLSFQLALDRGIPQQMLREMALRDMDHPSVLFYGLANESTGEQPRADALATLAATVKAIDATRLTGQAAYGFDPTDGTSDALDVAGFTFYHGVFYGDSVAQGTRNALSSAHRRYPKKPIMILEFGRWADPPDGPARQVAVFRSASAPMMGLRDDSPGGYVGALVWWALDDYYTMRPGISLERFGMFDTTGAARPVAAVAANAFATVPQAGAIAAGGASTTAGVGRVVEPTGATLRLVGLVLYGIAVSFAIVAVALVALLLAGGRRPVVDRAGRAGRVDLVDRVAVAGRTSAPADEEARRPGGGRRR